MLASALVTALPRAPARLAALPPLAMVAILGLAGCGFVSTTAPPATPTDFPGIASELAQRGLVLDGIRSGDPGCEGTDLAATAIAFTARGLDQAEAIPIYVYIFRNRAAWERRNTDVYRCAQAYATDPEDFESIEASPFIVTSPGPWAPRFRAQLEAGLTEAAGTGG